MDDYRIKSARENLEKSAEFKAAQEIVSNYIQHMSEDHKDKVELIKEAIEGRQCVEQLYRDVEKIIAGDMTPTVEVSKKQTIKNTLGQEEEAPQEQPLFKVDVGSTEALNIMDTKAAIWDVAALDIQLMPRSVEDSDKYIINSLNSAVNSLFKSPRYEEVISTAIHTSRGMPMAVTLLGWNSNIDRGGTTSSMYGDIVCHNIPVSNFWWDPATTSIEDSSYAMIQDVYTFRKIRQMLSGFSDFNEKLLEAVIHSEIDRYQFSPTTADTYRQNPQWQIDYGGIAMKTIFVKDIKEKHVKVYYVVRDNFIVATNIWEIPELPFCVLKEGAKVGAFTGVSSVMKALPYLKQKYALDASIADIMLKQKNPVYVTTTTAGISADDLNAYGNEPKLIVSNSELQNSLMQVPGPQVDGQLLNWRDRLELDIDKMVSTTDAATGIDFGSATTGAAAQMMAQQSTVKDNASVTQLKIYLVRFVSLVLAFMRTNVPEKSTKMKNGKNRKRWWFRGKNKRPDRGSDTYNIYEINKEDFDRLVAYDIDINVEVLKTTVQQQQKQDLFMLLQMSYQYKASTPLVTMQEIIETLKLPVDTRNAILERISDQTQERVTQKAVQFLELFTQLMQQPEFSQLPLDALVPIIVQQMQAVNAPIDDSDLDVSSLENNPNVQDIEGGSNA